MKTAIAAAALIVIGGVAYYAISPLFDTKRLDDPLPAGPSEREGMSAATSSGSEAEGAASAATGTASEAPMDEPVPAAKEEAQPIIAAEGAVEGTVGHPASGTAKLIESADGFILRYENFKTINGPELHVYLAASRDAEDYIDLGLIKGTEGNINYRIPPGTDLSKYRYALIWCVPFGVLFNSAELR